ncbi:hypothetical protein BJY04DRAFT_191648 [Aspergillus karnatakaensis]|uniref:DUF1993 domain-containing protein n=1 Tax=Aspergillus karnatakaensis TaxID=1810916 RepID=UPI003CCD499E
MASNVQTLTRGLRALKTILQKAESHAISTNIPPTDLVTARLVPDMLPLHFQVFTVTNSAVKAVARGTFTDPPAQKDTDRSFEEFYARIEETLASVQGVDVAVLDANKEKVIKVPMGPREVEFTVENYVNAFTVPTFFFHLVTAYDILRAKGVPLGKLDYLGGFLQGDTPSV